MSGTSVFYALLAGLLPALIWLFFWLKEDIHPEPRSLIIASFFSGFLAMIAAAYIEEFIQTFSLSIELKYTLWAYTEEIMKLLAVAIVALSTKYFDEPIDAMIYLICVALGFSAFENFFFITQEISDGTLATGLLTGNMRFMGATLLHIVSSAVIGFFIGLAYYKNLRTKTICLIIGVLGAGFIHTAFNLSIINAASEDIFKIFGWVWLSIIILIILFEEIKAVRSPLEPIPLIEDIHN